MEDFLRNKNLIHALKILPVSSNSINRTVFTPPDNSLGEIGPRTGLSIRVILQNGL